MVFFCCNKCGSSIKKPQVDKHSCRPFNLSCMDCHKDFRGDEFRSHTKCVSEEEKYAAAGWKAPPSRNKGEKKQVAWVETVQGVMKSAGNTLSPAVRNLLQMLTQHDNVPRKKPKFINFVTNIGRSRIEPRTLNEVWDLLEKQQKLEAEKLKPKQEVPPVDSNPPEKNDENGAESSKKDKKKKKKDKKHHDVGDANGTEASEIMLEEVKSIEDGDTKKKRKSKKRQAEDEGISEINDSVVEEEQDVKRKKKKSKNSEPEVEVAEVNTPKDSAKKRKYEETNDNADNISDEDYARQLKKQRKAERKAAKAAQNGHSLNEFDHDQTETNGITDETPEEIKARLKRERKLARKAAKAALNGL